MADSISISSQRHGEAAQAHRAYSIRSDKSAQITSRSSSPCRDSKHVTRYCMQEKSAVESERSLTSLSGSETLRETDTLKQNAKSTKKRLHGRARQFYAWPWWWEMWACIGSVASFMAMTGLLCAFDGKAQPEWPYGATLNSAVSWLSTITKGFLLVPWASCISQSIWISYMSKPQGLERLRIYDEASRGPWGSLELIWTLKARCVSSGIVLRSCC